MIIDTRRFTNLFNEIGDIVSHLDASVWGYGDELYPTGVFRQNNTWFVYYVAKGFSAGWDIGLAWGLRDVLGNSMEVLKQTERIQVCEPVLVEPDKIALFFKVGLDAGGSIEIRTASTGSPGVVSGIIDTYPNSSWMGTPFLDQERGLWFFYYKDPVHNNRIMAKTFPISTLDNLLVESTPSGVPFTIESI